VSFPFRGLPPLRHPGPPPAETDVVVLGGGVIGVMTAWHLAERGLRVVVSEKGRGGA
jgi:glycine/D-amino acid oxidase-like deaminating enzyme